MDRKKNSYIPFSEPVSPGADKERCLLECSLRTEVLFSHRSDRRERELKSIGGAYPGFSSKSD